MRRRRIAGVSLAVGLVALVFNAGPATAADGWARTLECGTNFRCSMASNTTQGVSYYVDSTLKASWSTSGTHSWSGAISAGSHTVSMSTAGTFSSHTASCFCPSGTVCAV